MLETQLKGAGPESGSGHVLALAVDSLHEWEERLQAAGVRIEDRTAYTLYLRDPDGHRVGLSVYRFDVGR
jgi:catechol 2,3-dioxygenase-like lactoylglutathione lyase family enzyme